MSVESFEDIKNEIQKVDGTVVNVTDDMTYIDVKVSEGNYNSIK